MQILETVTEGLGPEWQVANIGKARTKDSTKGYARGIRCGT